MEGNNGCLVDGMGLSAFKAADFSDFWDYYLVMGAMGRGFFYFNAKTQWRKEAWVYFRVFFLNHGWTRINTNGFVFYHGLHGLHGRALG